MVWPLFETAQDACLNKSALQCIRDESKASMNAREPAVPGAKPKVRAPCESVASFKARGVAPLVGVTGDELRVFRNFMRMEDLER